MKKAHSFIVTLTLIFAMAISSAASTATMAYAAENDVNAAAVDVQPQKSIVYPVSGMSSGYFTGLETTNNARYGNIPKGTYYFDYFYDAEGHLATIVIESSSERIERTLVGRADARSTETFDLKGGTYTVKIIASTGSYGITKYYSYTLILQ